MKFTKKIAIIPARGGSKRIPRKNVLDFFGKPMIAWTIEAAIQSDLFDKVLVSTEDEEIAQISTDFGADVPFLRKEYFDDFSTISMVAIHALEQAESHYQKNFDIVIQLMANCPLRDASDIINAYDNFVSKDTNFQISSFQYGWMNPWWAYEVDDQGHPERIFKKHIGRSQDLPSLQCPTGAIWVTKTDKFKKHQDFYGPGYQLCEMNWKSAVDIDGYDDLDIAKCLYLLKNEKVQ
jgi:CMP-N-acetylneuraminic acid synthetase